MDLYSKLPITFQNLLCNLYGYKEKNYRFGEIFKNEYQFLLKSDNYSEEEILNFQKKHLPFFLEKSCKISDYYNNLNIVGNNLEDFPVLTKEIIKNNFELIRSKKEFQKDARIVKTSGTTGKALSFIRSRESVSSQWAAWWRHRARFGFYPGDWHINFTGKPFVPYSQERPPFWRIDYFRNQILICTSQITSKKIKFILDFLNRKKISFITGYPSIVAQFCSLVQSEGYCFDYKPKLVTLGAEKCHDFQYKMIKKVTNTIITDQYGFSEGCGNASKCSHGNYHIDWEMCHLECLDPVVNPDGSKTGKILATGYRNSAFPFIRYMTGDYATFAPDKYKCPCGIKSKVIFEINGRNEDYVLTSDGNKIMRFDYLFKLTYGIEEAQIIQNKIDEIVIKYVPNKDFSNKDLNLIKSASQKYINPNLIINFISVEKIPRTSNGKFRAVISNL